MTTNWQDSELDWSQDAKLTRQSFEHCRFTGPAILYLRERCFVNGGYARFTDDAKHVARAALTLNNDEAPPRVPGVAIIECADCLFIDSDFTDVWIWSRGGTLTRWQRLKRWLGGKK